MVGLDVNMIVPVCLFCLCVCVFVCIRGREGVSVCVHASICVCVCVTSHNKTVVIGWNAIICLLWICQKGFCDPEKNGIE